MKRGRFRCRRVVLGFLRRLRSCERVLGVGSGRGEMSAWSGWWQVELEGLSVQARELEGAIAANVAGILEL